MRTEQKKYRKTQKDVNDFETIGEKYTDKSRLKIQQVD